MGRSVVLREWSGNFQQMQILYKQNFWGGTQESAF